jgi:polygalacturonase
MFAPIQLRSWSMLVSGAAILSALVAAPVSRLLADPPLPNFSGLPTYNVTVPMSGVTTASPSNSASANATAINSFITYASGHGGGTVEIPAAATAYTSGQIKMRSNVNLQIDAGATLKDTNTSTTLITTNSNGLSNVEISGGGIIDGGATTTTGSANLVDMREVTTLAFIGVSIRNSGHEHLVPENDTNVTISGVTIADPGTLSANHGAYLSNTDGIDYSGSNFLIKNCNISDGDDDIVAKPASTACNNITITGCTIGAGHGITVGGGTAAGVSNLLVTNCTFNGTTYGLRIKAHDAMDPDTTSDGNNGGGPLHPLKNVIYKNITMTNVGTPIAIESFYDGGDTFAASPTDPNSYTYNLSTPAAINSTTPIYDNIAYENISATGANFSARINGLNTSPNSIDGLSFSNVKISANQQAQLWYANDVDLTGLSVAVPGSGGLSTYGLTNLTDTGPELLPGDFNRDGQVTTADIPAMMAALADLADYQTANSLSDAQLDVIADVNDDFQINNLDLQALISQLAASGGGSLSAVPEPSALILAVIGPAALLASFRRHRLRL